MKVKSMISQLFKIQSIFALLYTVSNPRRLIFQSNLQLKYLKSGFHFAYGHL